jgi:GDP-L-fucose synthase
MDKTAKVYVAGHRGLVGSAVVRRLEAEGFDRLVLRSRAELDLLDPRAVTELFERERPEYVVDCAARVGGIGDNLAAPAEFLHANLQIQNNLMWAAKESGVEAFLFVGSATVYPQDCPQPMREPQILDGRPEPANEAYAIAKIAGLKLCEYINAQYGLRFIACLPTNVYGPGASFDVRTAHVVPSLIRRVHEAERSGAAEVVVWGSGASRRDLLYVDDLADAIVFMLRHYGERAPLNVGTGDDIAIRELAEAVRRIVGYRGRLVFDTTKPEGVPRRLLDVARLNALGWRPGVGLDEGLKRTYAWYLANA